MAPSACVLGCSALSHYFSCQMHGPAHTLPCYPALTAPGILASLQTVHQARIEAVQGNYHKGANERIIPDLKQRLREQDAANQASQRPTIWCLPGCLKTTGAGMQHNCPQLCRALYMVALAATHASMESGPGQRSACLLRQPKRVDVNLSADLLGNWPPVQAWSPAHQLLAEDLTLPAVPGACSRRRDARMPGVATASMACAPCGRTCGGTTTRGTPAGSW